jgi:hypothetical protein
VRADNDPEYDPQRLRERIQKLERAVERLSKEDVILDSGRLLKLRAPNGHYYSVAATNAGALALTDLGTSLL